MPAVTLEQLTIADDPATWARLGFAVEGDACRVGGVRLRLTGAPPAREAAPASPAARSGLAGWTLRGAASAQLDGLQTTLAPDGAAAPPGPPPAHPNGIAALDHVVAITPDLDRTVAVLRHAGLDLRRVREQPTPAGAPRQAFFRLGAEILEVVQAPEEALARSGGADGPAFFWGLAFVAPDLDATAARLGDAVGAPRDAVQPGRRIATLRRTAGLALPVALMTPKLAPS